MNWVFLGLVMLLGSFAHGLDYEVLNNILKGAESPPREYFSINGVYLEDGSLVQIGRDHINQNYVILPSPNVVRSEIDEARGVNKVLLQLYYKNTEAELVKKYQVQESNIHYLYVQEATILDSEGHKVWQTHIPEGVSYRLQETIELEVPKDMRSLSFVFKFAGRSGWSEQGISSEIRNMMKSIKDLKIDSDGKLEVNINVGESYQLKDVFSGKENTLINDIIGQFQYITVWGQMREREEILKKISDLQQFQLIDVDFHNYLEDIKRYSYIFGNPPKTEWVSVLKKLSSEKLNENEMESDTSFSGKFGLDSVFSLGADTSDKQKSRSKSLVKFDMEGEFYVPKSLSFYLRQNQSIEQIKGLLFRAYNSLEDKTFAFGLGVALKKMPPVPEKPILDIASLLMGSYTGWKSDWRMICPNNQVMVGLHSVFNNNDRLFKANCAELFLKNQPAEKFQIVNRAPTTFVHNPDNPFQYTCPQNTVMVEIATKYAHKNFDRQYSFACFNLQAPTSKNHLQIHLQNCHWSSSINNWQSPMDFKCPAKEVMAGLAGTHDNRYEDRLFQINCCEAILNE